MPGEPPLLPPLTLWSLVSATLQAIQSDFYLYLIELILGLSHICAILFKS